MSIERSERRAEDELKMRVRVISQTFTDPWRHRDRLDPFKSGFFAVELTALMIQVVFHVLAAAGWVIERASAAAFSQFLRGETYTRWEPIRQSR